MTVTGHCSTCTKICINFIPRYRLIWFLHKTTSPLWLYDALGVGVSLPVIFFTGFFLTSRNVTSLIVCYSICGLNNLCAVLFVYYLFVIIIIFLSEMRGYISADRYFADIRSFLRIRIGYGYRFDGRRFFYKIRKTLRVVRRVAL